MITTVFYPSSRQHHDGVDSGLRSLPKKESMLEVSTIIA